MGEKERERASEPASEGDRDRDSEAARGQEESVSERASAPAIESRLARSLALYLSIPRYLASSPARSLTSFLAPSPDSLARTLARQLARSLAPSLPP